MTLDIIRAQKTSPHNRSAQFRDGSRCGYAANAIGLTLMTRPVWRDFRAWSITPSNDLKSGSLWVHTALIAYGCDRPALPHPIGWRSAINLVYS
ncbi:hypothetical protein [Microcoleus asticus]|uniref:hypothetical protein n=1 Tax=Microcoleus asticus TaxID=2815231 RepID=UPI001557DC42|nr:hypothetical protein [Microcoleus asticus]